MKRLAAAASLLLALAACGAGGSSSSSTSATTGQRDDAAVAKDANLRLTDFPTEWRSTPVDAATLAAAANENRTLALCMGRPAPEDIRTAEADSDDFSAQDTRRVSSSVQLVKTEEIAKDDFAVLSGDKALSCHKAGIDAEFARQLPASAAPQTTIERLQLPTFGDETVGYRISATTVNNGQQVRTLIDLVFVRRGRAELSGSFLNVGTPFPVDLERTLLQRMVGRA